MKLNRTLFISFLAALTLGAASCGEKEIPIINTGGSNNNGNTDLASGNEMVIYEANPKVFASSGAFKAMEDRLDEIQDLGVNEDIGTVKLPNMIKKFTGANPQFEFTSGHGFPDDLSPYKLIIHCGGCMISEKEVRYRMNMAIDEGIPFTNYGTAIAFMKGILKRSTEMFED